MSQVNREVRLVRMADAHLPATHRWLCGSAELRWQVDCLAPPTEDGNKAYWHAKWRDATREDYAVVDAGGKHIGNCGLCDIDHQRHKAQLWIYLGGDYGAGNGNLAVRKLLSRAFEELNLNRVYLRVVSDNPRAQRFYEKIGFVREGLFRQDTVHDGKYVDSVWMSILATEFPSGAPRKKGGL